MARSSLSARALDPAGQMSAEDEAAFEAMRAADTATPEELPAQRQPQPQEPMSQPDQTDADSEDALIEERSRRQQLEGQLAEQNQRMRLMEERTNLALQRFAAPPPRQVPPLPDASVDPIGHIVQRLERQDQQFAQIRTAQQQREQQAVAVQRLQQLDHRVRGMETAFSTEHPDYGQAVNFLIAQRHREMDALGLRNPDDRQARITHEALGVAVMALQNGVNPAEVLYNYARARGYQSAASSARERQQGQQQGRSLGMTAARLAAMSEADFAKAIESPANLALLGA
jgi:hypothetical protein